VVSHKWIESFALGVSLVKSKFSIKHSIRYFLPYTIMVPLGVVIGSTLSLFIKGMVYAIIESCLESIAAGTFIYIALVDVLIPEFFLREDRIPKFFLAILGYVSLSTVTYFFDHSVERNH